MNVSRLKTNAKKLETKISWLNKLFHRYGFNQPAYDLRYRYAVMEISTHNKVFDRVVQVQEQMTEIAKLKLENQLLRDEIERLKMLLKDR
ncbi:hypothetical protein NIES22_15690 [Calothrix brevissima NIES-22]|nr:hypothetical protein NIES22_15690 [Calothrix brevissima NIES-22]